MTKSLMDMVKELDPEPEVVRALEMYVELSERSQDALALAVEGLERIANQTYQGKHKPPSAYSARWTLAEVRKALTEKE